MAIVLFIGFIIVLALGCKTTRDWLNFLGVIVAIIVYCSSEYYLTDLEQLVLWLPILVWIWSREKAQQYDTARQSRGQNP